MAKAFIAARELGLTLLPTAWGLNDRGYHEYFGTSRLDFLRLHALATFLPRYTFTENDFRATGERDFEKAIHVYARDHDLHDKPAFVLMTEGLWGEFHAIRNAAPFILRTLYGTHHTVENLYHFAKLTVDRDLIVAVNIRLTDFAIPTPETDFRGLWNTRIPLTWYSRVCRSLRSSLGDAVTFYLVTDGKPEELRDFIEEFHPLVHWDVRYSDISNLLIMSQADALICSISSYSEWAAFLSKAPYFWYRPHLRPVEGRETIWGYLADASPIAGLKDASYPRGVPVDDSGEVSDWVVEYLRQRRSLNRLPLDLVRSGGVPSGGKR